ncbi:peptidoglycan bridge formation glycyltransferase FemA/FemB family protein [Candidatus Peregrinibacteria bacterium]|nr:peptidoglycan bridge formation glycyltransferase FemA/FemB family protein [Candidatus Peregrinibacteria bacterium]
MNNYLAFWKGNKRRNLWQHPLWSAFQSAVHRKVFLLEADGASALLVKHDLPLGFSWLECPRGPLFKNGKGLLQILMDIREAAKKQKAIFVRLSPFEALKTKDYGLKNSQHDTQPQTSLILDLEQSEEELLKQMKPKGRYNIKVAEKHEVTVKSSLDTDTFYHLLSSTGFRDKFGIHPKSYYRKMLQSMPENAHLLLAKCNGEVIAGGLFVYLDEWGIYYYGASAETYRNTMAPYLIQWEAIKEAKKRGCKHYDFLGIAPEGAEGHAWSGVTEFKKKFGGRVVDYPQAKEMVLRPFWYFIYQCYKKFR